MEVFLCPSCRLSLWEPVTVSCGHSFCRRCLGEDWPAQCCVCGDKLVPLGSRTLKCNNVLLCDLLEKCLDRGTRVARLKVDLEDLLRSGNYKGALQTLRKGVALAPDDLELRMCRSELYVSLQQYPEALKDLETLCLQEPEECEDLKQSQEVWQEETMSDQNLTSNSGVSAKKKEDSENRATAETTGAKSTQDIRNLLSTSDLECSLCIRMFFEPVTTPCGHTFCKECVERSLDHRPNCPLCKQSLREYLKARKYSTTVVLEELMSTVFPLQLADRRQIHQTEMAELSNLTKNIPIFVCTLAFPGIVCSLHVFEPRYRLMIRRCWETGTKMFGMCISENGKSFADYGCMLEIQKIDFLPDGRSFVNTTGKRRFRVLRRGHKDGYNTADIEYLEDGKVEGEELAELQNLHDCTYKLTQRFYENGYMTFRRSLTHYGPLPEKEEDIQASPDGPAWCWWLILTLPLDVSRKLAIFSDTSLKSRLIQMKNILSVILESSEFNC